jgi:hypothetical protein
MQNSEIFMGLFFTIGLGFSAMALWARGQMRLERKFALAAQRGRSKTAHRMDELDRQIAELTARRDQLAVRGGHSQVP